MKELLGNGLDTIVSQALQKMKEEQGESFHIETVNLAALQRMTGISRGRLRRWKKNLLSPEQNFRKRKSILDDYTSVLDHLLSSGVSNTVICFEESAVIVMDSDNKKLEDAINKTKQAIKKAFADKQYMCWVTYGKEVENYLTARSINEAYNSQLTNDIGRYEIISDYLKGIRNDFSFVKVPFARKVAPHITKADYRDDLEEKIRELVERITKWNE